MAYRSLDPARIIATLEQLCRRIEERFPQAGLLRVARELTSLTQQCAPEALALAHPNWPLRIAAGVVITLMLAVALGLLAIPLTRAFPSTFQSAGDYLQAIDATLNDVVLLGIGVFFLVTVEGRIKRRRALRWIHQVRSIAHVLDMHQLTKDPEKLLAPRPDTPSSPVRTMTAAELGRYLDYCSELLSLAGKVAALFVQRFNDPVVLEAVNDVETLTTELAQKVWQKISLLDRVARPQLASAPGYAPE
jgi:hypothetical protein